MLERTAWRAGFVMLLIHVYGQPAVGEWRPATFDRSMIELRRTLDDAISDGTHAYNLATDLWTMRAIRVALQAANARP